MIRSLVSHPITRLTAITTRIWLLNALVLLIWAHFFWLNAGLRTPIGLTRITTFRTHSILRYWEPSIAAHQYEFTSGAQPRPGNDDKSEIAQMDERLQLCFSMPGLQLWTRKPNDFTGTNRHVVLFSHVLVVITAFVLWTVQHLLTRRRDGRKVE